MAQALSTGWPAVLAGAPLPALLLGDDGRIRWANPAAEAVLGAGTAALEGRDACDLLPARLREEHRAGLRRLVWAGGPGTTERREGWAVLRAGGEEHPVDLHLVRTGADPPFALLLEDRGPLRALEAQVRRAEGLLADAVRLADVGTWEWDLAADRLWWSEELYRMAGRDPATFTPSIERFLEIVHPDALEVVEGAIRRLLEAPDTYTFRARILRPDGEVRDVLVTQQPAAADGPPTRFFGVVRDITPPAAPDDLPRLVHEALVAWERGDEGARGLAGLLGAAMGFLATALWLPDPEAGRIVLRAFWAEADAELDELEAASRRAELVPGTGVAGRAWSEARPVVVADIPGEAGFRRRGAAVRAGVVGAAAVPAVVDGEVLAVVELFSDEPGKVAEIPPDLLAFVGAQVGAVLARAGRRLARPLLTAREREVLQLAADGLGIGAIAERLVVSPATVKTHFQKVYDKLGVRDRAAAVAEGMRLGLVA